MKKLVLTLISCLVLVVTLQAQAPEGVTYQAVARDGNGALLSNQSIDVRFTIHEGNPTGTSVYIETHSISTNDYGLFTTSLGMGAASSGTFSGVNWGGNSHFLQVEVDAGNGYVDLGTTQLMSVPYALYAKEAGNVPTYTGGTGISVAGSTITNTGDTNPGDDINTGDAAGGDLNGTYPNPDVVAIQGRPVSVNAPTAGQVLKWDGNAWAPGADATGGGGSSVWSTVGSNAYYTAGDVGIGTNSPVAQLHVDASNQSEMARFESSAASSWISLYQGSTRRGIIWGVGNDLKIRADQDALAFQTGGNNVDRLFINAAGDVGIGTSSPAATLEVEGSFLNSNGQVSIETNSETSSQYFEITKNNVLLSQDVVTIEVQSGASNNAQFIEFQRGGVVEARINTDGSAEFESVEFGDGTVQETAATGPIAYGFINSSGSVTSGSGNFTCTYNSSSNRYEITITGESYFFSSYTTVVTPTTNGYATTSSQSGNLLVYLRDSAGNPITGNFQFITYK